MCAFNQIIRTPIASHFRNETGSSHHAANIRPRYRNAGILHVSFKMGQNILSLLARKPLDAEYIVRKSVSDIGAQ